MWMENTLVVSCINHRGRLSLRPLDLDPVEELCRQTLASILSPTLEARCCYCYGERLTHSGPG